MLNAQFVYESSVMALPKSEQLKLAALILEELTATSAPVLDFSDSWSEEDLRDLTAFTGHHAHECYPEETGHG
jgi:hypothetical protein